MYKYIFAVILLCATHLLAIDVDDKTPFYDILSQSTIYIDKTKYLELKDIVEKKNDFVKNKKQTLAYGYAPDFNVWIQVTLKNITNNNLYKILEYDNPLTTHISFYMPSEHYAQEEGLYQITTNRKTLNPIFKITLKPQESKTFYIKATSHITTLIIKLKLWNNEPFYEKEILHQLLLGLFFASMLILGIYNLFIYFFIKEISYLYYVLYLFGIVVHQMIYVGMSNSYLFSHNIRILFIEYAPLVVAFPIVFLALFTKSFLKIKQYKIFNKILIIYLMVFPFILSIFFFTEQFKQNRNLFTLLLLIYLVIVTVYAAYKRNRQAYFILFGWCIILIAGVLMYTSSVGILNIDQNNFYVVEISFVLEAVIFSIALADKIKYLQIEKDFVNARLIFQQQNEKKMLKVKVEEKTNDLKNALDEKEMLLKELNHRVKNNMQTIISLIRLQLDNIDDLYVKNILSTTYNRVTAMSHLHDLLYYQTNILNINANEYFVLLADEIQESYSKDIKVHLEVSCELNINQAIYCGLIVNELTTNSFKHAFKNNSGNVYIQLSKENNYYFLSVIDDGMGYKKQRPSHSLGITLVNSLVKSKLKGEVTVASKDGVSIKIKWKDKNE